MVGQPGLFDFDERLKELSANGERRKSCSPAGDYIMGRQQFLWYVEESVEGAHPDTSHRWHRGCVSA